jgi:DNA polymerase I-like protein with 3'-5' exonuclease and polymerase domains
MTSTYAPTATAVAQSPQKTLSGQNNAVTSAKGVAGFRPLVLDIEGPIHNNGHPFTPRNRLSLVGLYDGSTYDVYDIEHSGRPYGESLKSIQALVDGADVLIAFNSKFDLHWLRRYGIKFLHKKLWCLQYAEFCISGQVWAYPSLHEASVLRGGIGKSDVIEEKYWSKGVETVLIPWDELVLYNKQDCLSEWDLFQRQVEYLKDRPQLKKLIWYGCQDLLVTEEMEWNGLKYDHEKSLSIGNVFRDESAAIDKKLQELAGRVPVLFSSPADLSALLYGGLIKEVYKEQYEFRYKDGRTAIKSRPCVREHVLPRLVEPLKGSKTKKEGQFSTDEGTLKRLKASGQAQQIISLLLRKRELDKKVGTYYHGIPKLAAEKEWEDGVLHGQLNHCRAASGRLSSNNPNQQNLDYGVRECVVTRFPLASASST